MSGVETEKSNKNTRKSAMGKDLWNSRKLDLVLEGKGVAEGGGMKYGSS